MLPNINEVSHDQASRGNVGNIFKDGGGIFQQNRYDKQAQKTPQTLFHPGGSIVSRCRINSDNIYGYEDVVEAEVTNT